jgi:hypothetical protein
LIETLVFEKNANFSAENWQNSQKIVIITSTPGTNVMIGCCGYGLDSGFDCRDHGFVAREAPVFRRRVGRNIVHTDIETWILHLSGILWTFFCPIVWQHFNRHCRQLTIAYLHAPKTWLGSN